jgi:GNAT superfamily N-acetyltransferase
MENKSNLQYPEKITFNTRTFNIYSIKQEFCYMKCDFCNCCGQIKYFPNTKIIIPHGAHSNKCKKNKENEKKSIIHEQKNANNNLKIYKLEDINLIIEKNVINPNNYLKKEYNSVSFKIEKVKLLYTNRLPEGAKSLIAKVIKNKGKTMGILVNDFVASSVSYIEWEIKGIKLLEVILLATDENFAGKGMGKHLIAELMTMGKVVAWSDIGALEFYKKLGWVEDNVLGWELASELSYATYSVFVHYGISEEERIKLIG